MFPGSGSYWVEATLKVDSAATVPGWWRAPVVIGMGFDNGNFTTLELGGLHLMFMGLRQPR